MIGEGDKIPEFEALNQDGEKVKSEDIDDALIYFYPKANTPGCTKEASNFRDNIKELGSAGLTVYGVSTDSVKSQKNFHTKQNLNFDLLADRDKEIAEKFGVLQRVGTAERTTFLVRNGKVEKLFRKVSPSKHIEEILDYLG